MQRGRGVRLSLCFALAAVFAGIPSLGSAQQFKFNLADPAGPHEVLNENMQKWGEDIKRATNGAVQIVMHWNGALFKNPDIRRAVQSGQIELGTQFMQNLGPEKRLFEIDGLPFLVRSYDECAKLWDIQRPYIAAHMQKQGLRLLYAAPWPSQAFFFKKEVNSLADVKGVRQRAQNELASRLAQLMGTVPTTVQVTDISQAMLTGTIQAFNTSATTAVNMKLWEVASHFYDANASIPKHMVFMNEQAFSKLPAKVQQAIVDASMVADKRGLEMSREQVEIARKKLVEMGMKGGQPSATLLRELAVIGDTLRSEWVQKADEDSKLVLNQFLKVAGRS